MSTLEVNGQLVGYFVEGEGDPFLLLPGTTMDRTAFDLVRAAMPAGATYSFVMMEYPGAGESAMPVEALTVEALADQAHAVMQHLGHDRYHVAGYSLGAVIAAGVAAYHAASVRTATLIAGWIVADARMRLTFDLWKRLIATDPHLFMRYAYADGLTAPAVSMMEPMLDMAIDLGAGKLAPGSAAHLDLDIALDITDLVPRITAPTLVIGGAEDRWVDVGQSYQLAERIAGARLEVLPVGHFVTVEQAAQVAELLHEHAIAG